MIADWITDSSTNTQTTFGMFAQPFASLSVPCCYCNMNKKHLFSQQKKHACFPFSLQITYAGFIRYFIGTYYLVLFSILLLFVRSIIVSILHNRGLFVCLQVSLCCISIVTSLNASELCDKIDTNTLISFVRSFDKNASIQFIHYNQSPLIGIYTFFTTFGSPFGSCRSSVDRCSTDRNEKLGQYFFCSLLLARRSLRRSLQLHKSSTGIYFVYVVSISGIQMYKYHPLSSSPLFTAISI